MVVHVRPALRHEIRRAAACLFVLVVPGIAGGQQYGELRGVVRDSLGGGIVGAEVSLEGSAQRMSTASDGAFRFPRISAGEVTVQVRRLGYRPASARTNIRPGANTPLELNLSPVAARMPVVEVRGKRQVYDSRLAGFNARKEKQVGHFITRERLDGMPSARFVDVLRQVPGVRMRVLRGGVATVTMRGARCSPLVFIDGFPATAGVLDLDMIDLASVEGIEVYSGAATVPPEFTSVRGLQNCGVIGIWSRPFRNRQRRQAPVDLEGLERLIAERKVYTAEQVDKPAILTSSPTSSPAYPDSLWNAGVSGGAVAELIVDADGYVESGTVSIVSATHPYFAAAVRASLEGAVFEPAKINGQAVRQMVQLPFRFERKDTSGGREASSTR